MGNTFTDATAAAGAGGGESTLSLSFWDVVERVADYLGYGAALVGDGAGDNFARVRRCVEDGYRQFLFPLFPGEKQVHQWNFLRPHTTLAFVSTTWSYTLPDDFGGLIGEFVYPVGTGLSSPKRVEVERILRMRAGSDSSGDPNYYAIRPATLVAATGQRWQAIFYPTPSTAHTMLYRYRVLPAKWAVARISQAVTVGETPWTVLTGAGNYTTAAVVAGDRIALTGSGGPTEGLYTVLTKDSTTQLTMTAAAGASGAMNAEVFAATLYHYGGVSHSKTLLESCFQQAELQVNDVGDGPHGKAWVMELMRSLAIDREMGADILGYNGDDSDGRDWPYPPVGTMTVNGVVVYTP